MGQASEWESEGSSASAYDTDDSVQREVTQSIKAAKRKAKLEKRIMDRTERQKEEEEEREGGEGGKERREKKEEKKGKTERNRSKCDYKLMQLKRKKH